MYTSSSTSSSPPLQGCMAPTNGPLSTVPPPSLQTQQQQLQQPTYFMTDAAGNNMAFPLNMAFTLLPINNGEVVIQELSNGGDACTTDTNSTTANADEAQQVSF